MSRDGKTGCWLDWVGLLAAGWRAGQKEGWSMMMWLTTSVGKSWILRGNLVCGLGETLCDFVEGCAVLTLDSAGWQCLS